MIEKFFEDGNHLRTAILEKIVPGVGEVAAGRLGETAPPLFVEDVVEAEVLASPEDMQGDAPSPQVGETGLDLRQDRVAAMAWR